MQFDKYTHTHTHTYMGGKRKKCRKERVGSVAANSDNLGSNKETGGGHKVRECVPFVAFVQRFS